MKKLFFLVLLVASFSNAQSLQNAIKLTDSEQYTSADKELRDLIKADASKPEYYYFLAENFSERKEIDSALFYLKLATTKDVALPFTIISQAKIKLLEKDFSAGKVLLDQVLASNKKNAELHRIATKALLDTDSKLFDEAIAYIDRAIELNEKNEDNYLLKGDALMLRSTANVNEAIKNYNFVLGINPKSARGLVRIAKIYVRLKSSSSDSSANAYFMEAQNLDPNYAPAYREHAELLMSANKIKRALENWKKYLEINNSLEARYRYMTTLFLGKQYCDVILEGVNLKNNGFSNFYVDRMLMSSYAECTNDKENATKGLTVSDAFFTKVPKEKIIASDYKYRAQLLTATGKDSLAIVDLNKGYELETKNKAEYLILIAKSYSKLKKHDKAIEYYELKGKESNLNATELFDLGRAYYSAKKYQLADTTFGKLNVAAPNYIPGFYWKGNASYQLDPKNEKWLAKAHYEKAFFMVKPEERTQGNNKRIMIDCGKYLVEYYIRNKDNTKAKEILTVLTEVDPADAQFKKQISELK
jgi:tetratricopeptide (TPR) repeat protein